MPTRVFCLDRRDSGDELGRMQTIWPKLDEPPFELDIGQSSLATVPYFGEFKL